MARFGHYVTVHELRRTGLTVVYSGHAETSPDEKFAIKVLKPSVLFADKEHEKTGANQFLNSARLQQKIVAGGSQYWAPIHEYGSSPDGTFYVTDKYERSLQKLIDGHIGLGAKGLHAIIEPIVEGLIELKKAYKRPHGNLKATNVLITGASSEMKVVLSDPLSDESIDAKVHWHDDLRAIGELIYQLVVHRPAPSLDGARIYDSKEWTRLKPQTNAWRDLCARLLAVRIRPEAITLESLVEELTELGKSKPVFSSRRLAVLSIPFFIAMAVVIYFDLIPSSVSLEDWNKLCDDHNEWIGPLYRKLGFTINKDSYDKINSAPAKNWIDEDPNLVKILGEERDDKNSRIWIAGYLERFRARDDITDVESMKNRPELAKANPFQTAEAIKAVKYLRSFFDPNTTKASKSWPMLVKIHKAATEFDQEYWLKPAASYLKYLVAKVRPPDKEIFKDVATNVSPQNKEIFEGVNEILVIKNNKVLDQLNSLRKNINGYKSRWPQVYDDLLRDTHQYVNREGSKEIYENWLKQATGYREMTNEEDPRSGEEWNDTIENTEKVIEFIQTYKPGSTDEFMRRLEDFKEKADDLSNIPRIVKNKDNIKQNVDQLNNTYSNLKAQIHDTSNKYVFKEINERLNGCYLLNEELSQATETIQSLWKKWNNLKDSNSNAPPDLVDRINRLEQIEQSNDQQELVQIALGTSLQSEAAYAAWIRLGELPDSSWPIDYNDLTQDRSIRDQLKIKFEEIKLENEPRSKYLLQVLAVTGIEHEKQFIGRNSSGDNVLSELVEFATAVNSDDSLEKCQNVESLAKDIAVFLAGDDWQNGNINMTTFSEESDLYESDTTASIDTFRQWLREVGRYKILEEDPRKKSQYLWNDTIRKIEREIDREVKDELELNPEGNYLAELQKLNEDFNNVRILIEYMNNLPLVEKYKEYIDKHDQHWEELVEVEKRIRPSYCRRLYHDSERQLIFAEGIGIALRENFEPVMDANGIPAEVSSWDKIRQAINDKQERWIDFFHTMSDTDGNNVGWPKYIRSKEDHSVILRFIPAGNGNPGPFYMAIHEITNAQYERFITNTEAKLGTEMYQDRSSQRLLEWDALLPYPLYWNNHNEKLKEYPVTYVTHYGAESYANKWLGAQLPTVTQHKYAFSAASNTLPWSNQSQILTFAHVRAMPWREAAKDYNDAINGWSPKPKPLGAMRRSDEDYEGEKLKIDRIVVKSGKSDPDLAWPIASATEANEWGLFDMIGNVWEWCRQAESICGGSCLAPPEYIPDCEGYSPDNYSTKFSDLPSTSDIGFRVIVSIQ